MRHTDLRNRWLKVLPSVLPELPSFEAVDAVARHKDSIRVIDSRQIDADIHRSDVTHWYPQLKFKDDCARAKFHESLRRLLRAWCVLRPEVGYSQAMNFVAAILLQAVCKGDLPSAFELFCALIARLPSDFYSESPPLQGYLVEVEAIILVLEDRYPEMFEGAEGEGLREALQLASAKWLLNQWVGSLPLDVLLALWDQIFCADVGGDLKPATSIRLVVAMFALQPPSSLEGGPALYAELLRMGEEAVRKCGGRALLELVANEELEPWESAAELRREARLRLGYLEQSTARRSSGSDDVSRLSLAQFTAVRALMTAHAEVIQSDGRITLPVLEEALEGVNPEWGPLAAERIFRALDVEGVDVLCVHEVAAALAARIDGSLFERLCLIFEVFDRDGSGRLDADSLASMAATLIKMANFAPKGEVEISESSVRTPRTRERRERREGRGKRFQAAEKARIRARSSSCDSLSPLAPRPASGPNGRSFKRASTGMPAVRRPSAAVPMQLQRSKSELYLLPDKTSSEGVWSEARKLQQRLLWMDQVGDGCLSVEDWCHGAYTNAEIMRCFNTPIIPASPVHTSTPWQRGAETIRSSAEKYAQDCCPDLFAPVTSSFQAMQDALSSIGSMFRFRITIRTINTDTLGVEALAPHRGGGDEKRLELCSKPVGYSCVKENSFFADGSPDVRRSEHIRPLSPLCHAEYPDHLVADLATPGQGGSAETERL